MRHQTKEVKRHVNFCKYDKPEAAAIPTLWAELRSLATIVPPGEVAGVHRLRSSLLASVPSWQLPAFLDSLAREGALA